MLAGRLLYQCWTTSQNGTAPKRALRGALGEDVGLPVRTALLQNHLTQDGTIDYASTYYGDPEDCATDFAAIAVAGADPVADGWESIDLDEAQTDYDMLANPIASTDWYEGSDSDMVDEDQSGCAASAFVAAFLGTDE